MDTCIWSIPLPLDINQYMTHYLPLATILDSKDALPLGSGSHLSDAISTTEVLLNGYIGLVSCFLTSDR